ncbi:MAG: alanine--glyoxylate aminotransferase family protein, partial [Chloroflexi bacterium]|nr:alanine--glyoxylate aminotransferase family protein [Chloroflexota bacterium]
MNLRIPGPTPLPAESLKIMSKQMIDHRGVEFGDIMKRVTTNLKTCFQTKEDVFCLTSSGTGGMEAAIVNTMSPGDKVLSVSIGNFGERFAQIAENFGADVIKLPFELGTAADPVIVQRILEANPSIKHVLVTHNETSTGVTNDLASIAAVVRKYDKLLIVDAISSLGCIDLKTDEWGCDVVVTGSQKGWMAPPGLAMMSFSARAWEAHKKAKMPRFYLDVTQAKKFIDKSQTPWTPAVTVFYALDIGLEMMIKEGIQNVFERHKRLSQRSRDNARALGLTLFADPKYASHTITAVKATNGLDVKKFVSLLR